MKRLTIAILTLMLVGLATGCHLVYQGNPAGPKTAMLGDSIMEGVGGANAEYFLGDTHQTHRIGVAGALSTELVDEAAEFHNEVDVAVIDMGANDAYHITHYGATVGNTFDNGYTPVRDSFTNASCIVYVTMDENPPVNGYSGATMKQLNDWWRLHAIYFPDRYRIADWNAVMNYFGGWAALTWDGIHPTTAGGQLLGEVIEDAVATCPA